MRRDRREWVSQDYRSELEQLTFGEKVQSYVADDEVRGQRVVSVLTYLDTAGLGLPKSIILADTLALLFPPGQLATGYLSALQTIVLHHYSQSRRTAQYGVPEYEKLFLDGLELARRGPEPRIVIAVPGNNPYTS